MCEYLSGNKCKVNNDKCPFVYFCNKSNSWKPLKSMPDNCSIKSKKEQAKPPRGYYAVAFERKGWLHVYVKGALHKFRNPFDTIPPYVKLYKDVNGNWAIRAEVTK